MKIRKTIFNPKKAPDAIASRKFKGEDRMQITVSLSPACERRSIWPSRGTLQLGMRPKSKKLERLEPQRPPVRTFFLLQPSMGNIVCAYKHVGQGL